MSSSSPLEYLLAFAVVFIAGVIWSSGLGCQFRKIGHHA
ncbi:hypothetical protein SAMN05445871_1395 [Paraburkholderia caballeronis]|uniref:Uncharacterized protein n=1 Tax=Paraburkholderia caballeronis TaxID=416943 RepID=A0A1H7MTC2_9BURK|nr:hypothetical protein C7403_104300 [Paraburkholderia caballeronis]PXX01973.1 hypothetical protein C7407_104300 [Paraburkholderia caballeronis]RAK01130.1 hypothetical protein C7409_104300 [Paraburkholderia caballeronis]SEB96311.1 hypothetical protein SAMN05445871_1395 [Paraburkholderia caballeronis]SEL14530.1 hypothetical protein SAMN05192542_105169 [Paraburkholderia caballeronis]